MQRLCKCGVAADGSGHKKKRGNVVLIDSVSALFFKMGWRFVFNFQNSLFYVIFLFHNAILFI